MEPKGRDYMRGGFERIFSGYPERDSQKLPPINKYVFDPLLTLPWLGERISVNPAAVVLGQRNIPFMMIAKPQGVLTRLQNENYQITLSGGIAILPQHEGSAWKL